MKKKIALFLAMLCAVSAFTACSGKGDDTNVEPVVEYVEKGAEITVYLGNFPYDLDPGRVQFDSDMAKYYNLIYEGLFKISDSGKLEGALAKEWEYEIDERDGKLKLQIVLNSSSWSDGVAVDTDDVVYTFKRLLAPSNSNPAASLLYPIENAADAKAGLVTIDDVGFSAINAKTIEIVFEEEFTDVEYFLRNLANPVLFPIREDIVSANGEDWAQPMFVKRQRDADDTVNSIVTNGPFVVKEWTENAMILERSTYYRNLAPEAKLTKYVNPYRFIINFTDNLDDQIASYENTAEFLIGDFTAEGMAKYEKKLKDYADGSAYTYYFNTNNKLLSNANVRKALSIALDREQIASIVGKGAVPATGYVPTGIEADNKGKKDYRDQAPAVIETTAKLDEAKALLKEAKVKNGSITITIRKEIEWDKAVAEYVKSVWEDLGFTVKINTKHSIKSDKQSEVSDFEVALATGDFDVIGFDYCALSTDAYSFLAPYARQFSGSVVEVDDDAETSTPHITGYDNEEYNNLFLGTIERDEEGVITSATGILGAKDAKARMAIYQKAEAILAEEAPAAPLFFGTNGYLVSGKLSKYEFNNLGNPDFDKVKLSNYKKYKVSEVEE